jgi:fermentation-respiration switch protein FrsA (DUF1100 family)
MTVVLCAIVGFVVLIVMSVSLYGSLEITKVPFLAVPYIPEDFGLHHEDVSFLSHDGLKLTGWFIPANSPSPVTLLVLHGLGSNAGDMLLNTLCLARRGTWNLFYFNFRGHADSQGQLTSLGPLELKDMESALAYIRQAKPEATRRLGIYGHSLGGAVAIAGAAKYPELEAVIAESPFASTRRTIARFSKLYYGIPEFPFITIAVVLAGWRMGISMRDFSPLREIGKIAPRPLLLIHAERDLRMPYDDTQALFKAAGEPKDLWVVPGADHGEPWMVAKEEFEVRLVEFFRKVFP